MFSSGTGHNQIVSHKKLTVEEAMILLCKTYLKFWTTGSLFNIFDFFPGEIDQDTIAGDLRENFPIIRDHFDVTAIVGEGK